MIKKRFLSMLVLLCLTVSGAWAQEVTLLTTIENTGDNASFKSDSKTFDNIATVTFSGTVNNDGDNWGWYSSQERTLTVTAAEGYTITRVKFYTYFGSGVDEEAPFEAILLRDDGGANVTKVNGTSIGQIGVTKIEVYGYAGTPEPAGYTVSMPQDTPDAEKWTARAGTDGTYQQLPLEGVAAGTAVSVKYSGTKKVKSVKAVKKAADLSMLDCAGNERTDGQWTANCYMVHTAGNYKLPLVYGNAIKSGAPNAAAYTGVSGQLETFLRHDGNAITAPWIKDNGITVASADLLWQDAQGLVTAVGISGNYLTLTVGKDATKQEGNALVAAKDASGAIVWSWHIWVTEQTFATLTTVSTGNHDYQVTPVNLGWVTTGGDGKQGYCTYYQWGRKDAFIPGTGTNTTNNTVYDISGTEVANAITSSTDNVGIDGNIKNPTTFYDVDSKPNSTTYRNLWDAQQTNTNNIKTATTKTVYDPCPAGFCVPTGNLYYYMGNGSTRNEGNWDDTNKGKTWTLGSANLYFPASGYRSLSDGSLSDGSLSDGSLSDGSLSDVGSYGYCWSASAGGSYFGRNLYFGSGNWDWSNNYRALGFPVRAVAEE